MRPKCGHKIIPQTTFVPTFWTHIISELGCVRYFGTVIVISWHQQVILSTNSHFLLLGMAVGHTYYYLEDIFPNQPGGFKILKTPQILKVLCDESPDDPDYAPPPEERPGGYDWGAGGGVNPGAENDHNDNDDQNIGDNNNVLHNDENQNLQEMPPQNNNGVL